MNSSSFHFLPRKQEGGRGGGRAHSRLKIMLSVMKTVCTKKSGSISLSTNRCIEIMKLP